MTATEPTRAEPPATGPADGPAPRLGLVRQLGSFVAIGVLSAIVDFGVYHLLLSAGLWVPFAKGISFILGTTTAYLLNKRFTFEVPKVGGTGRFTGFLLLYGSTFFVNVGVNSVMLRIIPRDLPWQTSICWVIAQACATTINFLVLRMVIFRARSEES